MKLKIVHLSNTHDSRTRETRANAIHETAANAAEIRDHGVAADDNFSRSVLGKFVLAFDVLESVVFDDEVGSKH